MECTPHARRRATILVALHILAGCAVLAFSAPAAPLDDTYIHLVFGRSLVRGGFMQFNPGVPTTGLTSPLWILPSAAASLAGPTAVDMEDKCDTSVTQEGIDLLTRMAKKSVPGFNARGVITSFAGVRAQPSTGDFIIRYSEIQPKMLHVAGICSPGLTCAPAIAEDIALLLSENGMDTAVREDAVRVRSAIPEFRHMTDEQRERAIAENPLYGRVICRCETITEAEIVEAIRRGARSIDGVKRRTRAGMGRCQGGFCSPRVMEILVRETGIPVERLTKFGGGSWLVLNQADEKEAQ